MNRTTLKWGIIVTAAVTAIVHLALGIAGIAGGEPGGLDFAFVLNGLGYFALLGALFLDGIPYFPQNRKMAHYLMIVFAGVTFVLYFVFNGFELGAAAIVSKLAEALLIVATAMHMNASD